VVNQPTERELRLERKVLMQRYALQAAQEALQHRNRQLDAWHWVWCSGGCKGGVHRWPDEDGIFRQVALTEEVVQEAERGAQRLRAWWNTYRYRLAAYKRDLLRYYNLQHRAKYGTKWLRPWRRWRLSRLTEPLPPVVYDHTARTT
jgi:hypothetical protein